MIDHGYVQVQGIFVVERLDGFQFIQVGLPHLLVFSKSSNLHKYLDVDGEDGDKDEQQSTLPQDHLEFPTLHLLDRRLGCLLLLLLLDFVVLGLPCFHPLILGEELEFLELALKLPQFGLHRFDVFLLEVVEQTLCALNDLFDAPDELHHPQVNED